MANPGSVLLSFEHQNEKGFINFCSLVDPSRLQRDSIPESYLRLFPNINKVDWRGNRL